MRGLAAVPNCATAGLASAIGHDYCHRRCLANTHDSAAVKGGAGVVVKGGLCPASSGVPSVSFAFAGTPTLCLLVELQILLLAPTSMSSLAVLPQSQGDRSLRCSRASSPFFHPAFLPLHYI